jgi:Domain of unknown function (DUF4157)
MPSSFKPLQKSNSVQPNNSQRAQRVQTESAKATQPAGNEAAQLLAMQQSLGNRAVQRLLASQAIQAKLTVGGANDQYEQEADRVAQQVLNPSAHTHNASTHQANDSLQPKSSSSSSSAGSTTADNSVESSLTGAQGGMQLPGETMGFMEERFGADFSKVRIHTGNQAAQLNRSLQADAFTHGNNIYFDSGKYSPKSSQGQQLLAHELTHVVQQGGTSQIHRKASVQVNNTLPANRISTKKKKMYLDFVRMKRADPQFSKIIGGIIGNKKLKNKGANREGDDDTGTYGHWWTELGDMEGAYPGTWAPAESYGWWPSKSVSTKETFAGVEGSLNKGDTNDPHHGHNVGTSKMFHPVMDLDTSADYMAVRNKVVTDIRKFAKGYKGKWAWRLGWGKNCHTFQQALKKAVGIHYQKGDAWLKKPDDAESFGAQSARERSSAEDEAYNAKNPGTDFRLTKDVETSTEPIVTFPAGSVVRVTEDNGPIDSIPEWQMVMVIHNRKHYQIYLDAVTKNATKM